MHDSQIEVPRLKPAAQIGQIAFVDAELDSWVICFEARKESREAKRTDRRHDAELQRSLMQEPKFVGCVTGCVRLVEHLLDVRADAISEVAQKDAPPFAMKQRSAEFFFELLDG